MADDLYFYRLSASAPVQGPVSLARFGELLRAGQVDGLALVSSTGLGDVGFVALREVPALRALAASVAAEEDEGDGEGGSDEGEGDEQQEEGEEGEDRKELAARDRKTGELAGASSTSAPGAQPTASASASAAASAAASASAAAAASTAAYFYESAGSRRGPVPATAFASLLAAGYASRATLVWRAGMENWAALASEPLLAALADAYPPTQAFPPDDEDGDGAAAAESSGGVGAGAGGAPERSMKRPRSSSDGGDVADAPDDAGGAGVAAKSGASAHGKAQKRPKKNRAAKLLRNANCWVALLGLPPDATEDEVAAFAKRAGIINVDAVSGEQLLQLTRDDEEDGGDADVGLDGGRARVCYLRPESVELAVQLLDGAELRPGSGGYPLRVRAAPEAAPASARPAKQAARPAAKGDAEAQAARVRALEQQLRLSWADEGTDEANGLCIVVLRNLFSPAEAAAGGAAFVDELCDDVAPELEARCGPLAKLTVFARHAQGVALAKFAGAGAAARCIELMNGRFFGGRRLACGYWDGVEDFRGKEGEDEAAGRERDFGQWLEGGEGIAPTK